MAPLSRLRNLCAVISLLSFAAPNVYAVPQLTQSQESLQFSARGLELSEGSCDYLKVDVSGDSVFAASWEAPSGWAIPLTNFGRQAATVRVSLPQAKFRWAADARYSVRDTFNNNPVNGKSVTTVTGRGLEDITVPLGSLESALLVVRKVTDDRR